MSKVGSNPTLSAMKIAKQLIKYLKILSLIAISVIYLSGFNSCTKKEHPRQPPPTPQSAPPVHGDIQMPSPELMKIVVPDEVKDKWKGIILTVVDKHTMNGRDYKIPIGGTFRISDTNIEVKTGAFLPDLKIEDNVYSTDAMELLNPAIQVEIKEDGKELFKGWLFQKYPSVHPFKHERFSITLKKPLSAL